MDRVGAVEDPGDRDVEAGLFAREVGVAVFGGEGDGDGVKVIFRGILRDHADQLLFKRADETAGPDHQFVGVLFRHIAPAGEGVIVDVPDVPDLDRVAVQHRPVGHRAVSVDDPLDHHFEAGFFSGDPFVLAVGGDGDVDGQRRLA